MINTKTQRQIPVFAPDVAAIVERAAMSMVARKVVRQIGQNKSNQKPQRSVQSSETLLNSISEKEKKTVIAQHLGKTSKLAAGFAERTMNGE
ncbi:hypothetical protein [Haladaptatus litoreus]|uniref:hypothetical protein n=1 Tax=Haladaptatus litoreus TaxID=553468 RepID=UPI0011154C9E|nr:hypothetical protein [Haladaptatus litoreus]